MSRKKESQKSKSVKQQLKSLSRQVRNLEKQARRTKQATGACPDCGQIPVRRPIFGSEILEAFAGGWCMW